MLRTRFTRLKAPKVKVSGLTAFLSVSTFVVLSKLLYFESQPILSFLLVLLISLTLTVTIFNVPRRSYVSWSRHQFRNTVMTSNFVDEEQFEIHLANFKRLNRVLSSREQKRLRMLEDADRTE